MLKTHHKIEKSKHYRRTDQLTDGLMDEPTDKVTKNKYLKETYLGHQEQDQTGPDPVAAISHSDLLCLVLEVINWPMGTAD